MRVVRDLTAVEFLAAAGGLLYRDEAVNALMLGLAGEIAADAAGTDALFFRVEDGGGTVTAAVQTPPRNLILSFAEADALGCLVEFLIARGIAFPGVLGPATAVDDFARIWRQKTGAGSRVAMEQGIFQAKAIVHPERHGVLRPAREDDVETLSRWAYDFLEEADPLAPRIAASVRKSVEKSLRQGAVHVLEDGGRPVSMARVMQRTRHGALVSGVYTPPDFRRNGYASTAAADLSQLLLDGGCRFCFLYTDLSNPDSNSIYRKIGYKLVVESRVVVFLP